MSALLQQLATDGVTTEDIEKAAACRLFEKTAAAQGIDLASMDAGQQDELFAHFNEHVLPGMIDGGHVEGGDKTASAEEKVEESETEKEASNVTVAEVMGKVASLSDDVKMELFEKAAEAEGIDLSTFDDEKLAGTYGYFLEEMLPAIVAEGIQAEKSASVEEATEETKKEAEADKVAEAQTKLAEAEILGRHMARAFYDESQKLAGVAGAVDKARELGKRGLDAAKGMSGKQKAIVAGGALASGVAGGIAAKKHHDKKQAEKAAEAPILEALAMQKAAEILEANGIDPQTGEKKTEAEETKTEETEAGKQATIDDVVNARAVEILEGLGYSFE